MLLPGFGFLRLRNHVTMIRLLTSCNHPTVGFCGSAPTWKQSNGLLLLPHLFWNRCDQCAVGFRVLACMNTHEDTLRLVMPQPHPRNTPDLPSSKASQAEVPWCIFCCRSRKNLPMPLFPRSPSPPLLHLRKESDHEAHLRSIHAGEVGLMFVLKRFRIEVGVRGLAI